MIGAPNANKTFMFFQGCFFDRVGKGQSRFRSFPKEILGKKTKESASLPHLRHCVQPSMLCLNCAFLSSISFPTKRKVWIFLREGTCLLNSKQGKEAYLSCLSRIHQTAATGALRVGLRRQTSLRIVLASLLSLLTRPRSLFSTGYKLQLKLVQWLAKLPLQHPRKLQPVHPTTNRCLVGERSSCLRICYSSSDREQPDYLRENRAHEREKNKAGFRSTSLQFERGLFTIQKCPPVLTLTEHKEQEENASLSEKKEANDIE